MKISKETPASWADVHSRSNRRRRLIFFVSFLVGICFVLAVAAWVVIYSPLFHVKDIEITGNANVSSDDIMSLASAEILGDSFWRNALGARNILIWPDKFSENSLRFLPEIKSLSIEKNYRQKKIKIIVEERRSFGVWCLRQATATTDNAEISPGCFWFDGDGMVFKKSINMEGSLIMVINDYSQKKLGLGFKILSDGLIANAFSVFRAISVSRLRVKEIRLNNIDSQELEVDTYDGPKIYFSLRFPADSASEFIQSLKAKSTIENLQYVDFRIENRVYYK